MTQSTISPGDFGVYPCLLVLSVSFFCPGLLIEIAGQFTPKVMELPPGDGRVTQQIPLSAYCDRALHVPSGQIYKIPPCSSFSDVQMSSK
jgi:hypothetical protein